MERSSKQVREQERKIAEHGNQMEELKERIADRERRIADLKRQLDGLPKEFKHLIQAALFRPWGWPEVTVPVAAQEQAPSWRAEGTSGPSAVPGAA